MRVTKYPQSCMLLEKNGRRILIDPGNFVADKYKAQDFMPIEAVLLTHLHPDHADLGLLREFQSLDVQIITNKETSEYFSGLDVKVVSDGDTFEVGSFELKVHELAHCLMLDGSTGPQNTGFIIDNKFFHPGDGVGTEGIEIDVVAVPIAGPDISPRDAFSFIKKLSAQMAVPVHYNFFPNDPGFFKEIVGRFDKDVDVAVLDDGESVVI